jgi:hypothetical protein
MLTQTIQMPLIAINTHCAAAQILGPGADSPIHSRNADTG